MTRKTFANCTTHGRVRALRETATEYHFNAFSGERWTTEKTVVVKTPSGLVKCEVCNQPTEAFVVNGSMNETVKCDTRCTDAKGHKCECECGGDNHGIAA